MRWSDTTAGVAGASGSMLGGATAVIVVAIALNGGAPAWRADSGAPPPESRLFIRPQQKPPRHARYHAARERPPAPSVTAPVRLAPRPRPRPAPAARPVGHHRSHRHHAVARQPAPIVPLPAPAPAPPPVPVPAPAPPSPPEAPVDKTKHGNKPPKAEKAHGRKAEAPDVELPDPTPPVPTEDIPGDPAGPGSPAEAGDEEAAPAATLRHGRGREDGRD